MNSSRSITYSVLFPLLCHGQGVVWDGVAFVHGLGLHCKCQGATPVLSINDRLQGPQGIGLVGNGKSPEEKNISFVMFLSKTTKWVVGENCWVALTYFESVERTGQEKCWGTSLVVGCAVQPPVRVKVTGGWTPGFLVTGSSKKHLKFYNVIWI